MTPRSLAARLGTAPEKVERLLLLLGLAMSLVAAAVLARAVADALFLSHAGVESLPLSFVVLAAVSLPVASGLSWLIGRTPRAPLLRATLVASGGLLVGLRLLLGATSAKYAFFALTVGVALLESLLDIQFWVLVADYLSPLEAKRANPYLAIAMAAGGLCGGGAARLLAEHLAAPDLLLAVLPFCALAFAILLRLEQRQVPLAGGRDEDADPGFVQSIAALPAMARRYPVIALIIAGGLLDVLLTGVAGYLVFGVYEATYPSAGDLAGFLGSLSAAMNVAEVLIIFFVTRVLVARWGVARMNLAYPLTTMAAFAGLMSGLRLPMAVAANLNTDTLANAVARPVENLTYGAIPHGLAGRVRVLAEGLVQPVGLALVGLVLWAVQDRVTLAQLGFGGAVAAVAYVGLGVWRGRGFVASLVAQLRDGSVDLASTGVGRLPARYAADVDELLADRDPEARCLGLELARRVDSGRYLDAAVSALADDEPATRVAAEGLLADQRRARDRQRVRALLADPRRSVRHGALVALLRGGQRVMAGDLAAVAADRDPGIVALASLAGAASPESILAAPGGEAGNREALVAALVAVSAPASGEGLPPGRSGLDHRLAAWVPPLLGVITDDRSRIGLLTVLARTAARGEPAAVTAAASFLASPAAAVRAAALHALASLATPESPVLAAVVEALDDAEHEVRLAAVRALEPFGAVALEPLVALLAAPRPEVQAAVIDAIGAIRTRGSAVVLTTFLARDLELAPRVARWQAVTPAAGPWQAVATALDDLGHRLVGRALAVLAALGHRREVAAIRRILAGGDVRRQMSAVETVAALPERRLVLPILPLLERLVEPVAATAAPAGLAEELAAIDDRWLRAGLAAAAASDDEEVRTLQRLLFLKRVSLFSELTLDELLRLDSVLGRRDVLAGETVFHQGALEERFYIVFRGEVAVRQDLAGETRELRRLGPGETFGEMALFDAAPRSATVVATADAALLVLDRERFLGLIAQLPRFATEICRVLTLRLRDAEERLRKAVTT